MDECRAAFEEWLVGKFLGGMERQFALDAWQAAWNRRAESGTFDKPFVFQTRPTVPEGWKLVPIEPTVEIVQAAQDYFVSHDEWGFSGMYRAMLAAAPEVKR